MATLNQQFTINGVVNTANNVFDNIEQFAMASGCWVTYDATAGRWSVVINQAGSAVRTFDDDNIIGSVEVTSTGITEFYNRVRVTYARRDLDDQIDFVEAFVPVWQRLPNETENILELTLDMVTDPVQALDIGARELKQSRVNTIVRFETDYRGLGLAAGDIIAITNSALNFASRLFRIVQIQENDQDSGEITCGITAVEYDPDVYNNDLTRVDRSVQNDIVTIGGIGQPAAPVLTLVERDARPHIEADAVVPSGLVAGMEFWVSVNGSEFYLQGTERPPAGGVYATGDTVSLDIQNISAGTIAVKVRAVNSRTSSIYSPTTTVTYQPEQVTNAVDSNTQVEDSLGGLATALGIIELLQGLDGLFSGNTDPGTPSGNLASQLDSELNFIANVAVGNITIESCVSPTLTMVASNTIDLTADPLNGTVTFDLAGNLQPGFNEFQFTVVDNETGNILPAGNVNTQDDGNIVTFETVNMDALVYANSTVSLGANCFAAISTGTDGNTIYPAVFTTSDTGVPDPGASTLHIPGQFPAQYGNGVSTVRIAVPETVVTSELVSFDTGNGNVLLRTVDLRIEPDAGSLVGISTLEQQAFPGSPIVGEVITTTLQPPRTRGVVVANGFVFWTGTFTPGEDSYSIFIELVQDGTTIGSFSDSGTTNDLSIPVLFFVSDGVLNPGAPTLEIRSTLSHSEASGVIVKLFVYAGLGLVDENDYERVGL